MFIAHFDELPFVKFVTKPASIGEIGSCLWLVIFGARASTSGA
jgi:hypothetical protein